MPHNQRCDSEGRLESYNLNKLKRRLTLFNAASVKTTAFKTPTRRKKTLTSNFMEKSLVSKILTTSSPEMPHMPVVSNKCVKMFYGKTTTLDRILARAR